MSLEFVWLDGASGNLIQLETQKNWHYGKPFIKLENLINESESLDSHWVMSFMFTNRTLTSVTIGSTDL